MSAGEPTPLSTSSPSSGRVDGFLSRPRTKLESHRNISSSRSLAVSCFSSHPQNRSSRRSSGIADLPVRWRPHADPSSPVRIDPEIRFGRPAVRGISTEVVWEHVESDESLGEVADEFELTPDEVRWAYAYEISARAA